MTSEAQRTPVTLRQLAGLLAQYETATGSDQEAAATAVTFVEYLLQSPLAQQIRQAASADLSKLNKTGVKDAMWVLGFGEGAAWEGGFRANRLRELVQARVLIPTETPGRFTVGWLAGDPRFPQA